MSETLRSGQAFRWKATGSGWESVIGGNWVRLSQHGEIIRATAASERAAADWTWLREYLQLDVDIDAITTTFPKDEHLTLAISACRGLRLLRQEPWECLASFILSSTKQIVQIQQIVQLVSERFGVRVAAPGVWQSFPQPERIGAADETDLRSCKMGFRAPYLKKTSQMVAAGEIDLENLRKLDVQGARSQLMRCPGVGRKIADCVLLFAYGFQEAFPVDVWILRALRQLYFPRRRPDPKRLLRFTQTYFGPYAGYAQQYLFHYIRIRQNEIVTS